MKIGMVGPGAHGYEYDTASAYGRPRGGGLQSYRGQNPGGDGRRSGRKLFTSGTCEKSPPAEDRVADAPGGKDCG